MSILVATDFSEQSIPAVKLAAMLAFQGGTSLTLLHVVDFTGDDNAWRILYETPDEVEKNARNASVKQLEELYEEEVPAEHRGDHELRVGFGEPSDGVIEVVDEGDVEMVVVGTVGSSRLQELFLGRTPNRLVRELDVPVVAVPPEWDVGPLKKILAPVDYSDCSKQSLITAAAVARAHGAELHILHTFGIPQPSPLIGATFGELDEQVESLREERLQALKTFIGDANVENVVTSYDVVGSRPAAAIRERVGDGDFDMVCMGTHGRRGLKRFFLGSTAERVLRDAPCPVMVIRGG